MNELHDARSEGDLDEGFDLLSSPLRRVRFGRGFVIAGPIGLAIALVASLWVSTMHVRHSLLVQVERTWIAGERLGLRVAVVATRSGPMEDTAIAVAVEQDGHTWPLPTPGIVEGGAIGEVSFEVPPLHPGTATLHIHVEGEGVDPIDERIDVEVNTTRAPMAGTPVVSGSVLQHGDDSDAQPRGLRIVVRPAGRLLAGFDNELFVRVTDEAGRPHRGEIEVVLVDGEYAGHVGDVERPPSLFRGVPDPLGVARLEGPLGSELLRVEVRAKGPDGAAVRRRLRMVSFAGAVDVVAEPAAVAPGDTIDVKAWGLSAKLAIHVDIHGSGGGLADVMHPPVVGREPPRPWQVPVGMPAGLLQIEAHNHLTAPGESTATAMVQITAADPTIAASLSPLIAAHRDAVERPRIERDYDATLERGWLDAVAVATLGPAEVDVGRRMLLGTLPTEIFGPPVALVTRPRLEQELARTQGRARIGMRVFLLGGGALFLGAMAVGMIRSHRRAADVTLGELRLDTAMAPDERAELEGELRRAARAGMLRGFGVIGIMASGIALTMFILERIVWVF